MNNHIILKGKLVTLRPLSLKDAPNFCRWFDDLEVTTYLARYNNAAPSLKEEREYIKDIKKKKNYLNFSIDTRAGEHIGTVSLLKIDFDNKHAEYGILIGEKKYWGQGYGTEAGKLIIDYGFKKLKLHRIFLRHVAYNFRGHKSYLKLGFKQEGVSRQHSFRNGHWHDEIMMGMLRDEYLKK
ncbi:MAG: GNAT family protein [Candidatus Paceibacterota bacterium]